MNRSSRARDPAFIGGLYALGAYGFWGVVPIYWKLVKAVPAHEVLAHRIFWSLFFWIALLLWKNQWSTFKKHAKNLRNFRPFSISALLISINWGVYIYAVTSDQVLESSLGYYMNPLMNVLLGMFFFKERLSFLQWVCVALAILGISQLASGVDHFPWIALTLVTSFGLYGVARKKAPLDALQGSALETFIVFPVALGYLIFLAATDQSVSLRPPFEWVLWLCIGGIVTALPLLWFSEAARRLKLSTLGFFQYLSPTLQFLVAVCLYDEPFTSSHKNAFICIWCAVLLFVIDLKLRAKAPVKAQIS